MPYINATDGRRQALRNGDTALTAGELNYQIFYYIKHNGSKFYFNYDEKGLVIKKFVDQFLSQGKNYQRYNDMTGVLIRCYIEIKRRLELTVDGLIDLAASYDDEINIYEDLKCKENGDIE